MARYINLDELLTTIDKNNGRLPSWLDECIVECKCYFDDDVAPVRHGHWEQVDDTKCKCSECEVITMIAQYPIGADKNYCPNCGAKMDGERKENDNDT